MAKEADLALRGQSWRRRFREHQESVEDCIGAASVRRDKSGVGLDRFVLGLGEVVVHSHGLQAHSSTGRGLNANLQLVPFLADIRDLHLRLRRDVTLHDTQYDPPFCDLNFVIDNYGTFPNVTVGLATCRIKFRYSKSIDPRPVIEEIRRSAATHGLDIEVRPEASPPELPADAPHLYTCT